MKRTTLHSTKKILITLALIVIGHGYCLSQDYKTGEFEPIITSPAPNITFPQFKGGKQGLNQYLKDNVIVNDSLAEINKEGVVVIDYKINTKNQIIAVSIDERHTTLNEDFHELILNVLRKASPWKSGLQDGKPFIAKLQISFKFD